MLRTPILALLLVALGSTAAVSMTGNHTKSESLVRTGFSEHTIESAGKTRPYLLYIPKSYKAEVAMPLVFFLHGGGGDRKQARNYKLQDKAEEAGFILVLPNGVSAFPGGRLATWNAGGCCGRARDTGSDDVGYIRAVIADVSERVSVDARRIYSTGMSNGGMMSYRLACEASDLFAAIAPVAGTDGMTMCSPTEPVPILHIHALDDTHVLYNGGAGKDVFKDEGKIMDFVSVPDTIDRWVKRYDLSPTPSRTLSVAGAYCDTYGSQSDTEVTLCVTETGGHSWPGSTVGVLTRDKKPSRAIDANDVIWEFFSRHSK